MSLARKALGGSLISVRAVWGGHALIWKLFLWYLPGIGQRVSQGSFQGGRAQHAKR